MKVNKCIKRQIHVCSSQYSTKHAAIVASSSQAVDSRSLEGPDETLQGHLDLEWNLALQGPLDLAHPDHNPVRRNHAEAEMQEIILMQN